MKNPDSAQPPGWSAQPPGWSAQPPGWSARPPVPSSRRLVAGATLAGLLLAACGSGSTATSADTTAAATATTTAAATATTTAAATATTTAAAAEGAAADDTATDDAAEERLQLPAVNVFDVGSGEEVSMTTLAEDDRPTLLWFYAPH